ncbi:MAG TPA: response regulator [Pyrinomonadaceae bacterium]|nr:response regulator [Pyrinomonadaceae bacterium]
MESVINSNTVQANSRVTTSLVSIVDDDDSVREAINSLLRSVGLRADVFGSAEEFLTSDAVKDTACLILDVRMPGMSGLELQARLAGTDYKIPIIFITAHASDREARVRALRAGALDFLYKPFTEEVLLKHVYAALRAGGG